MISYLGIKRWNDKIKWNHKWEKQFGFRKMTKIRMWTNTKCLVLSFFSSAASNESIRAIVYYSVCLYIFRRFYIFLKMIYSIWIYSLKDNLDKSKSSKTIRNVKLLFQTMVGRLDRTNCWISRKYNFLVITSERRLCNTAQTKILWFYFIVPRCIYQNSHQPVVTHPGSFRFQPKTIKYNIIYLLHTVEVNGWASWETVSSHRKKKKK